MGETVRFGRTVETTGAERLKMQAQQAQAVEWSVWAQELGERLLAVEERVMLFLGLNGSEKDQAPVLAMALGQQCGDLEEGFEGALKTAVEALREEAQVELAIVRDELNGRIDTKLYGTGLDIDAEEMRRSLYELRKDAEKSAEASTARIDALVEKLGKAEKARRDLLVRLVRMESTLRGLPAPQIKITGWTVDVATYTATPIMSNGESGPPIALRPMFERFFEETSPASR
jgi:hypothetical protein